MAESNPGRVVFLEADALAELMVGRAVVVALGARPADPARRTLTRVAVIPLSVTSRGLVEAIELAAGQPMLSTEAARQLVREEIVLMTGLTLRQAGVLECIASGWSNSEIASALGIGVHTVKRETQRILTQIRVDKRVDAVLWAVQYGLVATGPRSAAGLSRSPRRPSPVVA